MTSKPKYLFDGYEGDIESSESFEEDTVILDTTKHYAGAVGAKLPVSLVVLVLCGFLLYLVYAIFFA